MDLARAPRRVGRCDLDRGCRWSRRRCHLDRVRLPRRPPGSAFRVRARPRCRRARLRCRRGRAWRGRLSSSSAPFRSMSPKSWLRMRASRWLPSLRHWKVTLLPRSRVVGVTGTNGKTTTVHFVDSILRAHGWSTGVIGTLTGARTTPEAPDLQHLLAEWRDEGRDAVAMEVSSHAALCIASTPPGSP